MNILPLEHLLNLSMFTLFLLFTQWWQYRDETSPPELIFTAYIIGIFQSKYESLGVFIGVLACMAGGLSYWHIFANILDIHWLLSILLACTAAAFHILTVTYIWYKTYAFFHRKKRGVS